MIKITFLREGPANNSSSSHSIIFTKVPLKTDEYSEFGWDFFTASDRTSKLNYALISLWSCWRRHNDVGYDTANISHDVLRKFLQEQFIKWFEINFPESLIPDDWDVIFDGYVDHQSLFTFPCFRDVKKGLNVGFCKEWIVELLRDEYSILGGNDNTEESHSAIKYSEKVTDAIEVYNHLCEADKDTIAVKDDLSNDWVISNKNVLLKFQFQ